MGSYNSIMSRWVLILPLAALLPLLAQDAPAPQPAPETKQGTLKRDRNQPAPTTDKEEIPPEEDTSLSVTEYSFNPLQSKKDLQTGNYYFKKGSYIAAAGRFRAATKWDESNLEAWMRLGEAEEKIKDHKAAREAYNKYLELASDPKDAKSAAEIRNRLKKLK